jgi:hypothetical protein
MDTWQPIDSAPKNGTRILLFRPTAFCTCHIVIGLWNEDTRHDHPKPYWSHDAEHELGTKEARKFQPSHWMPLPEHPQIEAIASAGPAHPDHPPSLLHFANQRFQRR